MARKKKKDEPKKMSPGQYWEWRCSIEEIQKAKLNEKRVHLEKEIMQKEIENKKLKLALFKETLQASRRSVEFAESEYKKFIERLESDLEIDFKDCVIDEVTYEIKSANEDLQPNLDD